MAINVYNIKKWGKMIFGKSIMHVNQDIGKLYKKNSVCGYYNDLTNKVLLDKEHLNFTSVFPHSTLTFDGTVKDVYFPIAIFQYGLGAYDLYLKDKSSLMFDKFINHAKWALDNQDENGAWNNFGFIQPEEKYSSMAQGEGCSLLLRAYVETKDNKYYEAAKKAIYFMVNNIENNGTMKIENGRVYFYEFTNRPLVLNGWIFSLFGLYDYLLVNSKDKEIKNIYIKSIKTLKNELSFFDLKFWSKYDNKNRIASPFYHKLHISLLLTLSDITNDRFFYEYAIKFQKYNNNIFYRIKSFFIKAFQKIIEK